MKKFRGVFQFTILFCICWGAHGFIKKKYAAPLPKKISIQVDSHFSKEFKEKMQLFAQEHKKISLSAAILSELIKETFPVVESVILKNYLSDHVKITLKGAYPVALLNDDLVLASNNALVYRNVFSIENYNNLPLLHVAQSTKDKEQLYLSDACKKFIKTFDRSLLEEYEMQWINGTLIQLRDRKHPKLTLLIDAQTEVTDAVKTAYASIREKKLHQQTQSKRGRGWFVDARFRNQMIVFLRGEKV